MATKTYITPSGAVVDEAGQTISGPVNAGGAPVVNTSNLSPTPSPVVTPPPVVPFPTPPPIVAGQQITAPVAPEIGALESAIAARLGAKGIENKVAQAGQATQRELNDIETQIKVAQANALANQEEARKQGETLGYSTGLAGEVARTDAINAIRLSAIQQGLQGRLALAQQTAKTAAEEETRVQESRIEQLRQNIVANYDKFDAGQKARANAALLRLDKEDAFVAQQKENSKAVQGLIVDAYKNSAGNEQAKIAINKIKDLSLADPAYVEKALGILGPYLSDPNAARKALDEHNQAVANLAKTNAEINKVKAETLAKGASPEAADLKVNALTSATSLLDKFNKGVGTSAVGGNLLNRVEFVGDFLGKGTGRADFIVQFNNLKSLLSLDNIKLLKGQGAVSDAERKLLSEASAKLDRSQSESEFKSALEDVVKGLGGSVTKNDLASQVAAKGYDYNKMKADGMTDEQIKKAVGI